MGTHLARPGVLAGVPWPAVRNGHWTLSTFYRGAEMPAYGIKRVLLLIPSLLLATMVAFVSLRIVPGDPALEILMSEAQEGEAKFAQEELAALRAKLRTDKPIHVQYGIWSRNTLQLDFGPSF